MSITTTTRFGLYRWSSDADQILRDHLDASHANIEAYGAKFISGTALPAVGSPEYARTFFINTNTKDIYFYSAEDASGEWISINTDVILVSLAEDKGDLLVATGPDAWDILPVGTYGQVLTVTDNMANVGWSTILVTKGDLLSHNGSSLTNIGVGPNNYLLIADSAQSSGLKWALIDTPSIADGAVSTTKFQPSAVTESKFGAGSVLSSHISDNAVSTVKVADLSVTESKIGSLSVVADKILSGAVTEIKIQSGAVTTSKFGVSSVTSNKLTNLAVNSAAIADSSVITGVIADGSVTTNKISDANILSTHIADRSVTSGKILDGAVTAVKLGGQSVTAAKFADSSIQTVKVADSAVGSVAVANFAVTEPKFGNQSVTLQKFANGSVTSAKVSNGAIVDSKILDASVTTQKIAANSVLSSVLRQSTGLSVVGNSGAAISNVADIVATSDATLLQRVSGTLAFSTLVNESISDGSVTGEKIASSTVVDADIAADANITLSKLGNGVLQSNITVNTDNYLDGSVTWPKLSSSQTSDGVGVWLNYTPQVYRYDGYFTTIGDLDLVPTNHYQVLYAKYCKIHELIMVKCLIQMTVEFGEAAGSANGGLITLPFAPTNPNYTCIGDAYWTNLDAPQNQNTTYAINVNQFNAVAFGMPEPLIHSNTGLVIHLPPGSGTPYVMSTYWEEYDFVSFNVQYATTA